MATGTTKKELMGLKNVLEYSYTPISYTPIPTAKDLEVEGAVNDIRRATQRQFVGSWPAATSQQRSNRTKRTGLSYRQRQARGRNARRVS